jgi:iduronate 2-sulfatase
MNDSAMKPIRRFLRTAAAILFLALTTCFAAVAADTNKYNVLFIIADDLKAELGSYGSALAKTPNIDALARRGVQFNRAYCQYPLCNPSRASMLTGRHPKTTGVIGNRTDFRVDHPEFVTLPELFKKNGYASLRTGKIFHGGIDDPQSWTEGAETTRLPGVGGSRTIAPRTEDAPANGNRAAAGVAGGAESEGEGGAGLTSAQRSDRILMLEGNGESHGDYRMATRAIEFMRKYKDQPFFLGCGFVKPHSPPTAPKKFFDLYDVDKIPLPPNFAPRPTVPEGFPRAAIRPRNADLFIGRDASPDEARKMIQAYLASTSWMDSNVGRVLAELDRLGLREKTIIVFWGDHGYQLGENGKWSKAGSLFEVGTRTPFIIAAPKAKGNGKECERTVQAIDFYPTLAELCGLPLPAPVDGRSLVPLLKKPSARWNHPAYTIWSEDGLTLHGVSVRTEKWRYAEFQGGAGGAMLIDPKADPYETKNLADNPKYKKVRAELSKLVKEYAK